VAEEARYSRVPHAGARATSPFSTLDMVMLLRLLSVDPAPGRPGGIQKALQGATTVDPCSRPVPVTRPPAERQSRARH